MPTAFPDADAGTAVQASIDLVDAAAEQAWNDAVFEGGPVTAPVLRLWRYRAPAVVLGRSQQALARRAREGHEGGDGNEGLPLVERRAGGGAVLVGPWMLGLSLVVPVDHGWVAGRAIGASYVDLGQAITGAMRDLGVTAATPATEAEARRAPPALAWACFAGVTAQEVLVEGRKLVGLAQRRHRHGVLFVAGVLVDPVPWTLLARTMLPLVEPARGAEGKGPAGETPASIPGSTPESTPESIPASIPAATLSRVAAGLAAETLSMAEASGRPVDIGAVAEACRDRIVAGLAGA